MRNLPFIVLLLVAPLVGCSDDDTKSTIDAALDDSTVMLERARLALTAEPADPVTPTEAKDLAAEPTEIVLAGKIDAGEFTPFQAGQAPLMLSELPDEDHAAGDPEHAENCKFCARRLANAPKVIVTFNDADGNLLEIGAKELFALEKGDSVVVTGTAQFQEATGTVTIDASGLYKRKS